MKKIVSLLLVLVVCAGCFAGCGYSKTKEEESSISIKESPSKHTKYIRNYVGRNCASLGEIDFSRNCLKDEYGYADVRLILLTEDSSFIDVADTETLKEYVVTEQSVSPNTPLEITFIKGESDIETTYVESQNIEEIELSVKRISEVSSKN